MTALTNELLNGFARAVAHRFSEAARGLDRPSRQHIGRRPHERVLSGFLTPLAQQEEAEAPEDAGPPDLPFDDKYEQTHIGFEWSVPRDASERQATIRVEIGTHVFVRLIPTFEQARDNSRFDRGGEARPVEVWRRYALARTDGQPIAAEFRLDEVIAEGASRIELTDQLSDAWNDLPLDGHRPFDARREPRLRQPDIADAEVYEQWVATAFGNDRPAAHWRAGIDLRALPSPTEEGAFRLLLRLINLSDPTDRRLSAFVDPRLYAVTLRATIPAHAHTYSEFRVLPSSYRYDRSVAAIGINCQPRLTSNGDFLHLRTETVPVTEAPRLMPRQLESGALEFTTLSDPVEGPRLLNSMLQEMREYYRDDWASKVEGLRDPEERRDAETARTAFRGEIESFERGVQLLSGDPECPEANAFRLMNLAMQRAGQHRARPITDWHLFQLVFIVSRLPELAGDSRYREAAEAPLSILWFPAGGGKTEAFLGLITWSLFFDRLTGKHIGVSAFLRYPLRLLTYQQLQRVSWVLGQAEEVRLSNEVPGRPFSLGYYVGQSTTPNRINDRDHRRLRQDGVPANWQRVFRCPSCASRSVGLRYNYDLRLVEHYCQSAACRTGGGRLPVYIVDDDLYRYLPTVIVSTVDKLAQVGQNRRFSQLFGRFELYCPVHGAAFRGSNGHMCPASAQAAAGRRTEECGGGTVLWGPFDRAAPSLHVQDEMHLMREGLATFDSHYETTALELQRSIAAGSTGWCLIGATATIEGYRAQASHLYLRDGVRFPAPGPEAYASFYYETDKALLGRLYVGVLGVGRTHTPSVARAIALLYRIVDGIRRGATRDLEAAREYLNLPEASLEQIEQLAFLYEIVLTYVLTRKGGDQVGEAIDTRVRPEIEGPDGDAALRVETFNSSVDMPRMISTMEEIESGTADTPLTERIRGVVATNIISHGVDVDRFNVMVFAGLPRQYAEYIQASARVGRHVPGISLLVATPQGDRDRSVFDRFDKFHQYVDRLVEPVPVNRWSEPALELTLRGILASYLMGVVPRELGEEIYLVRHVKDRFATRGAEALNEDRVVDWVVRAVGANSAHAPSGFAEVVRRLTSRYYGQVTGAAPENDNENINIHLGSMRSLRDVDDPAWIRLRSREDAEMIAALSL